jgi:hypothetical protein
MTMNYSGNASSAAASPVEDVSRNGQLLLARRHDQRVRDIERLVTASWVELAEISIQVRDHEEWNLLGFHSFNAWLLDAAPRSRAMIYSAIGLLEELTDVSREDLRQIGIGNAHILKKLPRASRTNERVISAAKAQTPRDLLRTVTQTHPEHHLEAWVNPRLRFQVSQWAAIQEAIEECMAQYDGEITTREEALECIAAEWLESQ